MASSGSSSPPGVRRWIGVAASIILAVVVARSALGDTIEARATMLIAGALILWLSEVVPPHVPTLALIAGIPLLLGTMDSGFRLATVLHWAADPVLALFFGGFALGAAATRHRLDEHIAERTLVWSRHRRRGLLGLVMGATAMLSMWMSNIAAAAMMLAALRPHLHAGERTQRFRRALLLAVAMGANLGGMGSPIGTGPNAIAIASLEPWTRITFIQWMGLAVPLMIGMLAFAYVLIVRVYRVDGAYQPIDSRVEPLSGSARGLVALFVVTVAAWLSEPIHGVGSPVVALAAAAVLFGGGWLRREDLGRIDWSTLLLIAGGIVLGRLAEHAALLDVFASRWGLDHVPLPLRVTGMVLTAALMGAVMSNTASAAMLIPLALGLGFSRSIAVLIAIGTSFGVPFTISTPPNAMAYGEGDLDARDLLRLGLPLMIVGCLLVGLTGPWVLQRLGLP